MNNEYAVDFSLPYPHDPLFLILCKIHAKEFKRLCKDVYEKLPPRSFWVVVKGPKTDESCMWCEQPDKFEHFDGVFRWMDIPVERKRARCTHEWEIRDVGQLQDGTFLVDELCENCLERRERKAQDNEKHIEYVKKFEKDIIITQEGIFCINCAYFKIESSRCVYFETTKLKGILHMPSSSCHLFKKRIN
jgi:hypothetical protein